MGKHSSLGPIDPQIFGLPAHGIIEEFQRISTEITNDHYRNCVEAGACNPPVL